MPRWYRLTEIFASLMVVLLAAGTPVMARAQSSDWHRSHTHHSHKHHSRSHRSRSHHHRKHVARAAPVYHAALLEDADTGRVLYANNPNLSWPPASMAKMMLLLVTTEKIQAGRLSYDTPVRISKRVAKTGGSRLGLRQGHVYPLGELMKAALIKSANDAAVAVAEAVGGGSVEATVRMMNAKAQKLGMTGTVYHTVDGLPPTPGHDVDRTTPLDLATVARALIHTTNLLRWSRLQTAEFDDGAITLHNTNHLIGHYQGCDGLKTGFTYESGFNLTATAQRGDMRLISVILGAPSNPQRFKQTQKLLDWGFSNFAKVQLLKRGEALPVHVQVEQGPLIQPVTEGDLALVLRKDEVSALKLEYSVPSVVGGPVALGEPLGQVIVRDGGQVMSKMDVVSPVAVGASPGTLKTITIQADDKADNDASLNNSTQEKK
jgi:serine-type D-Ala-D-Ala carboxypeptidase (penicillin-binding protein 5/6)